MVAGLGVKVYMPVYRHFLLGALRRTTLRGRQERGGRDDNSAEEMGVPTPGRKKRKLKVRFEPRNLRGEDPCQCMDWVPLNLKLCSDTTLKKTKVHLLRDDQR